MTKLMLFVVVLAICYVGQAKHVHPRHVVDIQDDIKDPFVADIDGMSLEMIRNIKPSRFVPVNNALFFKKYPPCEEGFERDLLGICREVWE